MSRYTDAAAPMVDSAIAAASIAAQILMARRLIENWVLWILIDAVAIGLFASRELYATSGLYAVFLILSIIGLVGWARALRHA
jgi:nicotinamide mononucleotide transporter